MLPFKVAAKVSPSPQHKTVSRASSPARQTRQATRSAASSEAATRTQTTNSNVSSRRRTVGSATELEHRVVHGDRFFPASTVGSDCDPVHRPVPD